MREPRFDEATAFYGMERASLGLAFVGAVEQAADHVREYPDSCPVLRGHVRKARVHRFPYSVLYSVVGDRIRVLAVAHDRRRPYYWSDRR
jgi:plasmid stabilization system protein ParE